MKGGWLEGGGWKEEQLYELAPVCEGREGMGEEEEE